MFDHLRLVSAIVMFFAWLAFLFSLFAGGEPQPPFWFVIGATAVWGLFALLADRFD